MTMPELSVVVVVVVLVVPCLSVALEVEDVVVCPNAIAPMRAVANVTLKNNFGSRPEDL